MRRTHRILSILLALVIMLGMFPVVTLTSSAVDTVAVDTEYYLSSIISGGTTYFNGTVSSGRLGGSTDMVSAVAVKLESAGADGEYYIYFMDGETKTYIQAASNKTAGFKLVTEAADNCIWVIDNEAKTIISKAYSNRGIATQNTSTYTTISFYATSNFTKDDYSTTWFVPVGASETPAVTYTATFVDENGETVKEVTYAEGASRIAEPAVPAKEGYIGAWESYTLNGNITIRPVYTALPTVDAVTPVAGTPYRMAMVQEKLGKIYYLMGEMSGFYMNTSDAIENGVYYYLEATEGGYYLYCVNGGVKTYVNMVVSGAYVNGAYQDAPATVYTYDADLKTVVAVVNDANYIFGTKSSGTYTTVGPVKVSDDPFYMQFVALRPEDEVEDVIQGTPIDIPDFTAIGAALESGSSTTEKFIVKGVVDAIEDTNFGELYIRDGEGNRLFVYNVYDAEGENRYAAMTNAPQVGDMVTLLGVASNFYGKVEMYDAWMQDIVPAADISAATEIALAQPNKGAATTEKYLVTGKVISVASSQYGNITIMDEAGNTLYIYGVYNENGTVRYDAMPVKPAVGDTVTLYGVLCNYNGAQMKNAAVVGLIQSSIYNVFMTVGQDLTLTYTANVDDLLVGDHGTLGMVFTMGEKTVTVVASGKGDDGKYAFAFKGITPQCMADEITASLVLLDDAGTVLTTFVTREGFSIKSYVQQVAASYADDTALIRFLTDMIAYGDASQKYVGYNAETLVSTGMTGLGAASEALPGEGDNALTLNASASENAKFYSAGVRFDYINSLFVRFEATTDVKIVVKCNGVEQATYQFAAAEGKQTLYTDGIYAAEFGQVYTFELYTGDTLVQTLTYSVNSYVYRIMNRTEADGVTLTEMAELARALYRYGESAKAYAGI